MKLAFYNFGDPHYCVKEIDECSKNELCESMVKMYRYHESTLA